MVFIPFFILLSCFVILNYNNLIILLVNQHIYVIYILLLNLFYLNFTYLMRYQHMFILSFINFFWFTLLNCFFCVNLLILLNYTDIFVIFFIFAVLQKLNFIILDFKALFFDFYFYFSGFLGFVSKPNLFLNKFKLLFTQVNDRRKYILKKYVYTINHKRIAINYFIFSMWTALSGAALATMIRMELAFPGSPFFKGDSTRYLQTITAHGLIMVFFVVVPILFGGFANFLIPYHVGSKDVAYPRLNSIGFWIQPFAYLLVAKTAVLRQQFWKYYDKTSSYYPMLEKNNKRDLLLSNTYGDNLFQLASFTHNNSGEHTIPFKQKAAAVGDYKHITPGSFKTFFWNNVVNYPESFWYTVVRLSNQRRKKVYVTKCSDRTAVTAGWAFITPFSCNTKYTRVGSQDLLIIAVILAGVSTTVSFTNLLITRRTLAMPGLRNRRVLLPFITIALLLTLRMLAIITPVLGASMFMLLMDRHWQTTFFEFVYGGDTVLFQHLFWFFGHPEVYVLIIPTFGIINMTLPFLNTRRVASKHHLIWAIYVMAYMGFVVWGHHMYLVGLDHRSRSLYSTITIMISLPATIKVVNWTLTLINGALKIDVVLAWSIAYILVFLIGGFTGMWLSHVALNISMHDTFFVIGHFHLMLSGVVLVGSFTGFYYYFGALFGIKYSRFFAYMHLIYYNGGIWLTFVPMFWLGFSGMPRRIHDYPAVFMGWHSMASTGHMIALVGAIFFFLMILDSHIEKRVVVYSTLGLPRWHKRVQYYIFKIRYLQLVNKQLNVLPNFKVRSFLTKHYFNEYESFKN
jgi:heme/copper-type cytochrome/quinol oxidase subunit 1